MLYLVGLGLGDVKDITVKGLEVVKKCAKVYLEAYTSLLCANGDKTSLEEFYGRELQIADRELVESNANSILDQAVDADVAFLVVGDPFGATTHSDLVLRAHQRGIPYQVIHNASILTAIGACGLQLYNFGETVSIPFWTESWKPESFLDKIVANLNRGQHTLCLLDIRVKERTVEGLLKGKEIYEPPRFMTVDVAAEQLLAIAASRVDCVLSSDTLAVAMARVGADDQVIRCCSLGEMLSVDCGKPLHSLIVPAKLHPLEEEMLSLYK